MLILSILIGWKFLTANQGAKIRVYRKIMLKKFFIVLAVGRFQIKMKWAV